MMKGYYLCIRASVSHCQVSRRDRFVNLPPMLNSKLDYDVLALTPAKEASSEFDQTRFSTENSQLLQAGSQLANSLKKVRIFSTTLSIIYFTVLMYGSTLLSNESTLIHRTLLSNATTVEKV
jgi:hypothetical protein